jgi:hypothetical protein
MTSTITTIARVALNLGIAIDQAANCLWRIQGDCNDGWGLPDEMISARAFRAHIQGLIGPRPMRVINLLFFWQHSGNWWRLNHCHRAWRTEIERRHQPDHYRDWRQQ